jgi:hypothetical protein
VPTPDPAPADLAAMRDEAGEQYADAVGAFEAALVNLASIEVLLAEKRKHIATDGKAPNLLTFGGFQPDGFGEMRHREFVPNPPSKLKAAIAARVDALRPSFE